MGKLIHVASALLGASLLSACAAKPPEVEVFGTTSTVVLRETVSELEKEPVPGTVNEVWVEPMWDTVQRPGSLDPRGMYYRLPHNEVVGIRPGKMQKVEYPDGAENYAPPGN